jgi:starch phosphorylase
MHPLWYDSRMKDDRFPLIPERLSGLVELAFNLWWSWHPAARMVFKMLDRAGWKLSTHNPVQMLHEMGPDTYAQALKDPQFLRHYDAVMQRFENETKANGGWWFFENVADKENYPVAYFSAEYGLHHSLPFYAGGLGFLAGDFLKESSDLGVPLVAIGFMYPEGYLRQRMRPDGWQETESEVLEREKAPINRVLDEKGERLRVRVPVIDPLYIEVWKASVGRVSLYLLDTDIDANDPWNRQISSHLYIGTQEQRLRQELVLGIGGTEVLNTLGIKHSVLHLNEGHPSFAILERIRERVESGASFEQAFEDARATTVFTTHTPVAAGTDVFPFPLMEKYFCDYWPSLGLDRERFFQLGLDPNDPRAGFNMTAFALRASSYDNAVSKRHGEVARRMWHSLWPGEPEEKVPISHITNGVHLATWIEPRMELLLNKYLGPDWLHEQDETSTWELVDDIPDRELWETHYWLKMKLMIKIREQAREQWINEGMKSELILASGVLLDPNALTIGFARRFTEYKRASLILSDMERLKKILLDRWRPVQIIFAGKAHPSDDPGKKILQEVFNTAKDPALGGRIAFVEDYDEQLAQYMVHGVDLWLNNPRPPMEACGTSGMKAGLNGVPQLSVLDGWWIEGFNGKDGWAFSGTGSDEDDAKAIYNLLENEIVPLFFKIDSEGVPSEWTKVMKECIKSTAPRFSARRMLKEYCTNFYKTAFEAARK